jgi:hypothetical protein
MHTCPRCGKPAYLGKNRYRTKYGWFHHDCDQAAINSQGADTMKLSELKTIDTRQAIEDAHANLFTALRYGLVVGNPTDAIDREHVEKSCAILDLIRKANPLPSPLLDDLQSVEEVPEADIPFQDSGWSGR